ncbi:MAG TPA: Hpt domain-containing protein [Sphingobium sp.]|uniref:Hpt domain-containing protein n=1 Tax=Sphingobium sp. TaxID=1912891 RepID=UPI002ED44431
MPYHHLPLIDEAGLASAKRELGPALPRILGYYRQDGVSSITAIEDAMHSRNATAMVLPAHSLKGESRQLGAGRLAELAQHLEMTARSCIEDRQNLPDALMEDVRGLRALFQDSVAHLERAVSEPAATAVRPRVPGGPQRPVFGRRAS